MIYQKTLNKHVLVGTKNGSVIVGFVIEIYDNHMIIIERDKNEIIMLLDSIEFVRIYHNNIVSTQEQ